MRKVYVMYSSNKKKQFWVAVKQNLKNFFDMKSGYVLYVTLHIKLINVKFSKLLMAVYPE